jgi:hypothetical protein
MYDKIISTRKDKNMKRFIAVLSGLLILPAFAEVAPVYYDDVVEYTDDMIDAVEEEESASQQKQVTQRQNIGRSTSRAVATGSTSSRTTGSSRAVASSPRSAQTTSRGTISRAARTPSVTSRANLLPHVQQLLLLVLRLINL